MTAASAEDGHEYLAACDVPLVEAFDAALLDLDGVVYRGPTAVEHAVDSIGRLRARAVPAVYVTNNANRPPAAVAAALAALGVPAGPDDVMTSAQAAAALLREELAADAGVLAVGGPGLREALTAVGLRVLASADEAPLAVVQGFAPSVAWTDLAEATYAVRAGARFVATNLDLTIPTERGIAPGNGTLVSVVRTATGVEPVSAGKPQPAIFQQAARRVGANRPVVVGDRLDTDLAGAVAAGMAGLLVFTGVHDARAAALARAGERPRFLAQDLRGLFRPHPGPRRRGDGAWECGSSTAWVTGQSATVDDGGRGVVALRADADAEVLSLDAVRALCCAAWAAADAGRPLPALPLLRVLDEADGTPG